MVDSRESEAALAEAREKAAGTATGAAPMPRASTAVDEEVLLPPCVTSGCKGRSMPGALGRCEDCVVRAAIVQKDEPPAWVPPPNVGGADYWAVTLELIQTRGERDGARATVAEYGSRLQRAEQERDRALEALRAANVEAARLNEALRYRDETIAALDGRKGPPQAFNTVYGPPKAQSVMADLAAVFGPPQAPQAQGVSERARLLYEGAVRLAGCEVHRSDDGNGLDTFSLIFDGDDPGQAEVFVGLAASLLRAAEQAARGGPTP